MNPEDDPEYWNSVGYSLTLNGKRDKAQKYYEKTLEIDPDNVAALNNLANILLDQGKEDEALKYLKYTTQMHPDYAEAWINLGLSGIKTAITVSRSIKSLVLRKWGI